MKTKSIFDKMIKSPDSRALVGILIAAVVALSAFSIEATAQKRKAQAKPLPVCGNPNAACKTAVTFQPHDLPLRMSENAVIYESELFYAIILKSVRAPNDECEIFVPESERLAAQGLFPDNKVFSSRCATPGDLSYTNTSDKAHFMAVYAGTALADANRMLAQVKSTGKFPGANIRRMRAAFNGT